MKEKDGQARDSLLRLFPLLAASYPQVAALFGQLTGESPPSTSQIQAIIPKITRRVAAMDQNSKDELVKELLGLFPELADLTNQR